MRTQKYFNYKFSKKNDDNNFFVNITNNAAYEIIINKSFDQNIFLSGPIKSGKTNLLKIWKKNNNAIIFENNFEQIIKLNKNIAIDNIFEKNSEEEIFHIINHCKLFNLKILATSSLEISNFEFKLKDLFSRLRSFYQIKINKPDDEMCKILMNKLFYEKQIIIKNQEIFEYIFNRINRTYCEIYDLVDKLDKLSLEKKRQLTIPLIKEIL